tara:strand:+ start:1555 stop:1977 length:423 start_codon:yes stop_codon:yes gene_type:complete
MDLFIGKVNEVTHTIQLYDLRFNAKYLEKYVGKDVELEIRLASKTRSQKQNRWYWGVAIPTIIKWQLEQEGIEYTKDEIHYFILKNIVKPEVRVHPVMGEQVIIHKSKTTSQMNTKEFNAFKDNLQLYFAERAIDIPDPI